MAGLTLNIPQAFEVRAVELTTWRGAPAVVLEVRQLVGGDTEWKRAEPVRLGVNPDGGRDALALSLEHTST